MSERQAPPPPVATSKPSRRRRVLVLGVVVVLAPLVAVVTGTVVVLQAKGWEKFHAASAAMLPGLLVGDHFIVDGQAYGDGRLPRRGDIVAFRAPPQASSSLPGGARGASFVKRIIGVPGDRVTMTAGIPAFGDVRALQEPLGDYKYGTRTVARLRERLPNGASYEILRSGKEDGPLNNGGPYIVPADTYFVVGDNRDDSLDSRVARISQGQQTGWYVPFDYIIGQAKYVYWSGFDRLDRIDMALK